MPEFTESVITNHFIKGRLRLDHFKDGKTLITLGGKEITFRKKGSKSFGYVKKLPFLVISAVFFSNSHQSSFYEQSLFVVISFFMYITTMGCAQKVAHYIINKKCSKSFYVRFHSPHVRF